jgi:hypothetical protein
MSANGYWHDIPDEVMQEALKLGTWDQANDGRTKINRFMRRWAWEQDKARLDEDGAAYAKG